MQRSIFEILLEESHRTGRPVAEALRHHFLEAVLRRLPVESDRADFVLRGSVLTRQWAGTFPRPAQDLDFLATFPAASPALRAEETARRFLPPLASDRQDQVRFDVARCRAKPIWETSDFPGVRLTLFATSLGEPQVTTVDIGTGDPLVPDAEILDYRFSAGGTGPVWATHPATLAAWKLHGLCEWGPSLWRPKDLLDLWLITGHHAFPAQQMALALRAAFESRGYPAASARLTLQFGPHAPEQARPDLAASEPGNSPSLWATAAASRRWERFLKESRLPAPTDLLSVRDAVLARLAPALALLP